MSKSIAVDFDGTLCVDRFPEIGKPYYCTINLIKRAKKAGARLILWTCRANDKNGNTLDQAVEWCKQFGIEFDAVNENLPETEEKWGNDTRKVFADYYLDDKSVGYAQYDCLRQIVEALETGKLI